MKRTAAILLTLLLSSIAAAQTPPTGVYGIDFSANNSQPVSAVGHLRLRYNSGTNQLEQSIGGASYVSVGGSLQAAYTFGGAGGGVIGLTGLGGGLILRDNVTPLGAALFGVTDSTGLTNYFRVSASSVGAANLELDDGSSAGTAAANTGQLVWNNTFQLFMGSGNTSAYFPFVGLKRRTITTSASALVNDYIVEVNCASACTVTLPSAPAANTFLWIADTSGLAGTNNITVTGAQQINGAASYTIGTNRGSVGIEYNATATQWTILATNATGGGGVTFPLENNGGANTFTAVGPGGSGSNIGYQYALTNPSANGDVHSQWLDGLSTARLYLEMGQQGITGSVWFRCNSSFCGFFDSAGSLNGFKISSQVVTIRAGNNQDQFSFDGNNFIPSTGGGTHYVGSIVAPMPAVVTYALDSPLGSTLPSSSTITPTQTYHKVSGTSIVTTIATGSLPSGFNGLLAVECTGAVVFNTGGNILTSFTAIPNKTYLFFFDGSNWSVVGGG